MFSTFICVEKYSIIIIYENQGNYRCIISSYYHYLIFYYHLIIFCTLKYLKKSCSFHVVQRKKKKKKNSNIEIQRNQINSDSLNRRKQCPLCKRLIFRVFNLHLEARVIIWND